MNNEKELRSLTWKYFWKRKREEVCDFFKESYGLITFSIFIIAFWGCILLSGIDPAMESLITKVLFYTLIIIFILTAACLLFFLLYITTRSFINWVKQNWKWATKDAIKELNNKRRKNGKNRSRD